MILYLDTSALVKLYVDEHGSGAVRRLIAAAGHVATSVVALPEAAAAFARRRRAGHLDAHDASRLLRQLQGHWPGLLRLHVDAQSAARLAWEHGLRGMDAVHLAAACTLRDRTGNDNVVFCAFDDVLTRAARLEGLPVLAAPADR